MTVTMTCGASSDFFILKSYLEQHNAAKYVLNNVFLFELNKETSLNNACVKVFGEKKLKCHRRVAANCLIFLHLFFILE